MNPQGGSSPRIDFSLPPEIVVLIVVCSLLVIGVFTFAMRAFIRAGKQDAQNRRRRGATAKDPLDPKLPTDPDARR